MQVHAVVRLFFALHMADGVEFRDQVVAGVRDEELS